VKKELLASERDWRFECAGPDDGGKYRARITVYRPLALTIEMEDPDRIKACKNALDKTKFAFSSLARELRRRSANSH
jgi:hypothetical protein